MKPVSQTNQLAQFPLAARYTTRDLLALVGVAPSYSPEYRARLAAILRARLAAAIEDGYESDAGDIAAAVADLLAANPTSNV